MREDRGQYDAPYLNFRNGLYEEIRREAFGADIGQNSWLTAGEQDGFSSRLNLVAGKALLDVACGAGGPALRMAALTGCSVVGIDLQQDAISTARSVAEERGLQRACEFRIADAGRPLPFAEASFDAIVCIDAINHLPERPRIIADWRRLLKPGGRLVFTDPIIVTGPLTNREIALRSSTSFYSFVPPGYDEGVIERCGLRLLATENVTSNVAEVAERRNTARASRSSALREIEGDAAYEALQEFLAMTANIAREGRLSRFLFVAEK